MKNQIRMEHVEVAVSKVLQRLMEYAQVPPATAMRLFDTQAQGLSDQEAAERLVTYGKNEVAHEKAPAWYKQLFWAFINPFKIVLLILGGLSLVMDVILAPPGEREFKAVIIITTMVTVSGLLRFWQEFRSNRAAEQLRLLVQTTATVERREAGKKEVPMAELVPGDIVHLSAGDMIPADVLLLSAKDLFVSQAVLTGESLPVEKYDVLANIQEKVPARQLPCQQIPWNCPISVSWAPAW